MAFGQNTITDQNPRELILAEKNQEDPVPSKEELEVFIGKVTEIVVAHEETGFFVAKMVLPKGELPPKLTFKGKPWLGRVYTIKGVSKGFLEHERIGSEVECYGHWMEDEQYGLQFNAIFVNEKLPNSPEALEAFLGSGKIQGLGPHYAKLLVKKYGVGIIDVLDKEPEKLKEIGGIGDKKLATIIKSWKTYRNVYEIMSFMQLHGIGDSVGMRIYNEFGENSIRMIEQNPYCLTSVPMVGFRTSDKIAKSLGVGSMAPFRIKAGLKYTLEEAGKNEGHTALPFKLLAERTADLLNVEDVRPIEKELTQAVQAGNLIERSLKIKLVFRENWSERMVETDQKCVSTKGLVTVEKGVAKDFWRLTSFPRTQDLTRSQLQEDLKELNMGLDETQERAVINSYASKVSVITGGPGTGKTHTIKTILKVGQKHGWSIGLTAPTGRAAKRMEESTGHKASTLHRMLGFAPEKGFSFNETNRLKLDLLIVDESSMIDVWLLSALLKAMPDEGNIIFVGDVDQLPSVGAGNCLADMIECNHLPVSRLEKIHRQAENSRITVNAHKIIKKQFPELPKIEEGKDFVFIEANGNLEIQSQIKALCERLLKEGVHADQIQVISPQKGTEVGTQGLNEVLRPILNAQAKDLNMTLEDGSKIKFAPGDRVMQFRNNYDLEIFNGDVGIVDNLDEEDGSLVVAFDDDRLVHLSGTHLKDIRLAYAITIHKSQGTEHDHVIIPMTKSHQFMFTPNLLYTAVTRGKVKVYLVGEKQVIYRTVTANNKDYRYTGLMHEIVDVFAVREDPFKQ